MKTYLLLIILSSVLCGACKHQAKSQRKGYVLSIDQDQISGPRDTIFHIMNYKDSIAHNVAYKFVLVPVELSNFTNDTLKYITMTCSWDVIFTINQKTASTAGWGCDNNFPSFFTIAPQKSFIYKIPVLIEKDALKSNYSLKIGMYLFKYHEQGGFREFESFFESKNSFSPNYNKTVYKNVIWSNEVTIPKS